MKIYIHTRDLFDVDGDQKIFNTCIKMAKKCGLQYKPKLNIVNNIIELDLKGSKFNMVKYYALTMKLDGIKKGLKRIAYIMK